VTTSRVTTSSPNPLVAVVALCFGGLTAALTQTMVIPIQSELPELLHTSGSNAGWVITATLLAAAVSMPVAGRLADLYGKQRVLVVNAALLVIGSLVVAITSTLGPVLVGRALQGFAMGFIPVGISLMREFTPPRLTGTAIASMSATLGVGGAIGLPLAAWIADGHDWHLMFWVSAGLALLVMLATIFLVPHIHDAQPGHFDLVGGLGLAVGLVAFLVGVSKGNDWGWGSARTWSAIVVGLVVLIAWGAFELRQDEPLVDLRTTGRPQILLTNISAVAIGFGMMAQSIVVPQLLELPSATGYGLGQSILAAGLWMAPAGLMMMAFAPVSSHLMQRIGAQRTLMIGATVLGGGYLVALVLMDAPWQLLIASCIAAAGVGIGYAAMPTLILDAAPVREAASAVGVNALMRSVGTTLAAAVMATILTSSAVPVGGFALPTKGAFQACFLVGALAAFVGVAIAATIPRRRQGDTDDSTEPAAAEVA
jgi:MFS family permease